MLDDAQTRRAIRAARSEDWSYERFAQALLETEHAS
jgi:hypothetical protein